MKKNFIVGFLSGAILFGTVGAFAGQLVAVENPFRIQLNGKDVKIEGYNINDNTYFKLRDIADAVGGFEVGFDNGVIQLSKGGYKYSSADKTPQYSDYEAFSQMFDVQASVLDDDLQGRINASNHSDMGIYYATEESAKALIEKAYDVANLYLAEYDKSYAITMDALKAKVESTQSLYLDSTINSGFYDDGYYNDGGYSTGDGSYTDDESGTNDNSISNDYNYAENENWSNKLAMASTYWQACYDVLKSYYFDLYKYTGEVHVTLTVG